jgi:hypothetical protein
MLHLMRPQRHRVASACLLGPCTDLPYDPHTMTPASLPRQCLAGFPRVFSAVHVPRVAVVTLPLPGLLLRMQAHNADFSVRFIRVLFLYMRSQILSFKTEASAGSFCFFQASGAFAGCWMLGTM